MTRLNRRNLLKRVLGAIAIAPVAVAMIPDILDESTLAHPEEVGECSYVALHTLEREVSGGGYARQPIQLKLDDEGFLTNVAAVEFPIAASDWGTVASVELFDAQGRGFIFGSMRARKTICAGDSLRFPAGSIQVRMS
jgi:hypothetical protein